MHNINPETRVSRPLNIAVLTVSDTRTLENDTSGHALVELAQEAGHHCTAHQIVKDDIYQIRATVSGWIADPNIHYHHNFCI